MFVVMSRGRTTPPTIICMGSHRTKEDTTYLPHDSSEDKTHKLQRVDQWLVSTP
jgi:hypothetical protein